MNPLDRLVVRDIFEEAIRHLTPRQLAVALLRLEGLTDDQIALLLGISRHAATSRIRFAAERIARDVPELRSFLKDRCPTGRTHTRRDKPLEHGWACTDSAGLTDMPELESYLSTGAAAGLLGVTRQTLLRHCKQGRYAGAHRDGFRWLIPVSALEASRP